MLENLHNWLIQLVIGNKMVIANTHFEGRFKIKNPTNRTGYIFGNNFNSSYVDVINSISYSDDCGGGCAE